MALPSSAPKTMCTLSRPLQAEGTVGSITSAYLSIDRTLVWAASGETIYMDTVHVDPEAEILEFEVIPVDADGVFDLAGNMIHNWAYLLRVTFELDAELSKTVDYRFQPLEGELMDLDLVPQQNYVSIPPATVTGSEVIINIITDITGGTP